MLESKIGKGTECVIGWKSKGLYNSKLVALYSDFLRNVKYFGSKSIIQEKLQMFTSFMI